MTSGPAKPGTRTGVCIVRAVADEAVALRITVTRKADVDQRGGEIVSEPAGIVAALAEVSAFLHELARVQPRRPE